MLRPTVKSILIFVFLYLATGTGLAQDSAEPVNSMTLTVDTSFDPILLNDVEVTLVCTSGSPGRLVTRMGANSVYEWRVSDIDQDATYCQAYAALPRGFSVEYNSSGDAAFKSDENGCQYAEVATAQSNHCLMVISQDHVPLTVYKKWVGASGDEADIAVNLDCEGRPVESTRFINQGLAATWQLTRIPPEGLVCRVDEASGETYVSDENDCKDLIVLPGRGEACTMVNTKVVKRIEMLNRYGKVIMILVMMTAGLIAVRRYV